MSTGDLFAALVVTALYSATLVCLGVLVGHWISRRK